MKRGDYQWVWQSRDWPNWRYDLATLVSPMAELSRAQGLLLGRLAGLSKTQRDQVALAALIQEIGQSSQMAGERMDVQSVRTAMARKLGVHLGSPSTADRHVEGAVEMMMDATSSCDAPLTAERLFAWHAALFPTGYSGLAKIRVGSWRDDAAGPMQMVLGPVGRDGSDFKPPPADRLPAETRRFLDWLNSDSKEPPLIRAGLGYAWFMTLQPFDDGNGRVARAIGALLLARADRSPQCFYSLSTQLQREGKVYFDTLEQAQRGSMDVTVWLAWFLGAVSRAVDSAQLGLDAVLAKARFWQHWAATPLNGRQAKLLDLLLEDFEGKLTSSKWAAIAECSPDTALRDINDLVERGVLRKSEAGGRSTSYEMHQPSAE